MDFFNSVVKNSKSAANIAKLKVTSYSKNMQMSKLYEELGKLVYECSKNSRAQTPENAEEGQPAVVDIMSDEKIQLCIKNIQTLEESITEIESQVTDEKNNMQSAVKNENNSTQNAGSSNTQPGNAQACDAPNAEAGIKCPNCGSIQDPENVFCVDCGAKIK